MHLTVTTSANTPGLVVLAVDDEKDGMDILLERLEANRYVRRVITAFLRPRRCVTSAVTTPS